MMLEALLSVLGDSVRASADGFTSRCPAHDDPEQSLSVKQGDHGHALVICSAGCDSAKIFGALGLPSADSPEAEIPSTKESGNKIAAKGLPSIELVAVTRDNTHESLRAMVEANAREPRFFKRGGILVRQRLVCDLPIIEPFTNDALLGELGRAADFYRVVYVEKAGKRLQFCSPPMSVVRDIMSRPDWPFPRLNTIAHSPYFTAEGTLVDTAGFHEESGAFLHLNKGLVIPTVPTCPTSQDVDRAKALVIEDLFGDFPFTDQSSCAHAIGATITPFVRELIDGPVPLHAVDAPKPGTGKSLLVNLCALVSTGTAPGAIPETRSNDELRKQITALLLSSPSIVLLDNVHRKLADSSLAALLTAGTWQDRVLGVSQMVVLENRTLWFVTANNVALSSEMIRRTIRIRLDAAAIDPSTRKDFRHPLPSWARQVRGELVWACLVLVRHWLAQGKPKFVGETLGSFYSWVEVIGGILQAAEIPGFLEGRMALREELDDDEKEWRRFVHVWRDTLGTRPVQTKELLDLARRNDLLINIFGDDFPRSQLSRLGKALSSRRDTYIEGFRVVEVSIKDSKSRERNAWQLCPWDIGTMGQRSSSSEDARGQTNDTTVVGTKPRARRADMPNKTGMVSDDDAPALIERECSGKTSELNKEVKR
jgi:putative DNA primase/helicase